MNCKITLNSHFQLACASKCSTAELFLRQSGKPTLNQIKPRCSCGSKVQMIARPFGQPAMDKRRLVSSIIIKDQVDVENLGDCFLDSLKKLPELNRSVTTMTPSNNMPCLDILSTKQRCSAVTGVVVGGPLHLSGAHWQNRLRPVQSLNLPLSHPRPRQGLYQEEPYTVPQCRP